MLKAKTLILCLLTFAFFHDRGIASTKTLDYRVGVCTHFGLSGPYLPNWNIETLIPKVADLGAGWIRDELYWNHYEREKGVYELPARTRAWIDAANAAGIKVLLIFNGSSKLYADSYDAKAYAAAAANLARELKGKVGCIEILNEPHNFGFSKYHGGEWNGVEKDGSVSPWIGKYVAFLNTAAQAIKSANPEMKVIGLGSVPPSNYRMLEMGIVPQVDGLVDHPYSMQLTAEILPWADTPGQLKRDGFVTADQRGTFASLIRLYRAASGRYSGPREIWLTEWGFTSYQQTKPDLFAGAWSIACLSELSIPLYTPSRKTAACATTPSKTSVCSTWTTPTSPDSRRCAGSSISCAPAAAWIRLPKSTCCSKTPVPTNGRSRGTVRSSPLPDPSKPMRLSMRKNVPSSSFGLPSVRAAICNRVLPISASTQIGPNRTRFARRICGPARPLICQSSAKAAAYFSRA
ncbi:MAG: hypothetical protein K0R17_1451 [Rariglobus sp.]|nr:hypothetical protein [Rariglobus sp.]